MIPPVATIRMLIFFLPLLPVCLPLATPLTDYCLPTLCSPYLHLLVP
jgi:hypothetical protein